MQAELARAKESYSAKNQFSEAQEILNRWKMDKEKFEKLQSKIQQPAHIEHVLLEAFRPKNPNDIKLVCGYASGEARNIIKQDSRGLSSPRVDKFNRPVDAFNLCEEEICAIHLYTQVGHMSARVVCTSRSRMSDWYQHLRFVELLCFPSMWNMCVILLCSP